MRTLRLYSRTPPNMRHIDPEWWMHASRKYWDSVAPVYDTLYRNGWSLRENLQVQMILKSLDIPMYGKVLDLGCGTGLAADLLRSVGVNATYVGLDISATLLKQLRNKHSGFVVLASMAPGLPFAGATFDAVIATFTSLSYSPDWDVTIREAHRVLVPGGKLYLSTLNRWSLRRCLRGRLLSAEWYKTRNVDIHLATTPAWAISHRKIKRVLKNNNFHEVQCHAIGVLSGVFELERLWTVDRWLCRGFPTLAHMTDWYAIKAEIQ